MLCLALKKENFKKCLQLEQTLETTSKEFHLSPTDIKAKLDPATRDLNLLLMQYAEKQIRCSKHTFYLKENKQRAT